MSDIGPTPSSDNPDTPGVFRKSIWIICVTGCVVFLCVSLVMFGSCLDPVLSDSSAISPNSETTIDNVDSIETQKKEANSSEVDAPDTLNFQPSNTGQTSNKIGPGLNTQSPQLGQIVFALKTTENNEPIDPDFIFEAGITEIHAVFEYTNMSPDYVWTQIWYYNGNELVSTSQPWPKGENGSFDYTIEAGGQPLSSGEWTLELYVEDQLLAGGSFVIEDNSK